MISNQVPSNQVPFSETDFAKIMNLLVHEQNMDKVLRSIGFFQKMRYP